MYIISIYLSIHPSIHLSIYVKIPGEMMESPRVWPAPPPHSTKISLDIFRFFWGNMAKTGVGAGPKNVTWYAEHAKLHKFGVWRGGWKMYVVHKAPVQLTFQDSSLGKPCLGPTRGWYNTFVWPPRSPLKNVSYMFFAQGVEMLLHEKILNWCDLAWCSVT